MLKLGGQPPTGEVPEPWDLEDEFPTEAWVYPFDEQDEAGQKTRKFRVIWFVDADGDGRYLQVLSEVVTSASDVSDTPIIEVPAKLFGEAVTTGPVATWPELAEDPVPLTVDTAFFKAAESQDPGPLRHRDRPGRPGARARRGPRRVPGRGRAVAPPGAGRGAATDRLLHPHAGGPGRSARSLRRRDGRRPPRTRHL